MRGDAPFFYHFIVKPVRKHWKRVAVAALIVLAYAAVSAI